jgi:hypothetical protein
MRMAFCEENRFQAQTKCSTKELNLEGRKKLCFQKLCSQKLCSQKLWPQKLYSQKLCYQKLCSQKIWFSEIMLSEIMFLEIMFSEHHFLQCTFHQNLVFDGFPVQRLRLVPGERHSVYFAVQVHLSLSGHPSVFLTTTTSTATKGHRNWNATNNSG